MLELPDAQVYAQQTGKMAAMKEVEQTLAKATANWRQGEKAVEEGLRKLNKFKRQHSSSTKIKMDTSGIQSATRNIEHASLGMKKRFSAARPAMQQSTPFAASSFSNSGSTTHYHTTTNSSDSNFWTMAWMYMLLSDNGHAHGNADTPTLLDPQKFEADYQNANGGLGLTGDFSNLDFSMGDPDVSVERDRSFAASTDGGFNIDASSFDVPAMEVESSGGGSSWGSSSSSASSSSDSSWASSPSYSDSSSSSSGSSCGSSCGGGGSSD